MFDFSKLIREIRVMAEKLSTWKFILIWLVFVIMASGYFIGQICSKGSSQSKANAMTNQDSIDLSDLRGMVSFPDKR
ncbi:TPA: hypothetical protein N6790_004406 [Escherichia coli]|nr:hypothetical protein [Escherichia coli]HCN9322352.1 hypothetical protein [Escherichia coli]HCS0269293.1 hypothetical protein [Escherichia coli]